MANPISATLFRLGFNLKCKKTWITEWVVPKKLYFIYLQKTVALMFFLKNFFNQYTTPLFQKTFLRNTRNDENIEMTGEENIIKNLFVDLTFLHAKTNIYCGLKLQVIISLYDSLMEELRNNQLVYNKDIIDQLNTMFKIIKKKLKRKRYYINKKRISRKKDNYKTVSPKVKRIIMRILRKLSLQPNIEKSIFYPVLKKYNFFKKKYAFWPKKHVITRRNLRFILRLRRKTRTFGKNRRKKWFLGWKKRIKFFPWFDRKFNVKLAKNLKHI